MTIFSVNEKLVFFEVNCVFNHKKTEQNDRSFYIVFQNEPFYTSKRSILQSKMNHSDE